MFSGKYLSKSCELSPLITAMAHCIRNFENLLFNQPILSFLFGVLVYLPLMTILLILWIIQTLFAVALYLISNILSISGYDAVNRFRDGYRYREITENTINTVRSSTSNSDRCSVRVLQLNAFYTFGRFWTRKPMMEDLIRSLCPDIISVNEAVRSRIWNFGTINMITNLWPDTKCESVSCGGYECVHHKFPLLFQYSFVWDYVIGELQLALNTIFLLPFLRRWGWVMMLKG